MEEVVSLDVVGLGAERESDPLAQAVAFGLELLDLLAGESQVGLPPGKNA
ncbi:hypothetical protein [Kitasatospora sp. NPDC005856]